MKKRATSTGRKTSSSAASRKTAKRAVRTRADSPDDSNPLAQSAPAKLAGLLQLGEVDVQWSDADLAAILKHQLAQPLAPVVEQYLPAGGTRDLAMGSKSSKIKTFGDLFGKAAPPVELLDIARQYARDCRNAGDKALPPVIAGALYWLAIAAATAADAKCHSKLSKTDMEVGLKWLGDQKWVMPALRKLAAKAAGKM